MTSDSKIRKINAQAVARAKRETPKPALLTWCLRQVLHYRYGWRPYY